MHNEEKIYYAVKQSINLRSAILYLKWSVNGHSYRKIKEAIKILKLSTGHFQTIVRSKRRWNDMQLAEAVKNSLSLTETLEALGLVPRGHNYRTIKKYIKKMQIDTSHFQTRSTKSRKMSINGRKYSNEEMFVVGRRWCTSTLKKRILSDQLLPYRCALCNNVGIHKNKKLVLQLDHINGNALNNRLDNLRFLCPNCHSQTPTFCGLQTVTYVDNRYQPKYDKRKCDHDAVRKRFKELNNYTKTGVEFGISDNAVKKIINRVYNLKEKTKRIRINRYNSGIV